MVVALLNQVICLVFFAFFFKKIDIGKSGASAMEGHKFEKWYLESC